MDYSLINLQSIKREIPRGSITIGLIDGPVNRSHPDFKGIRITSIAGRGPATCAMPDSPACVHGTFVAGILCARPGSQAPGICPEANVVSRPLFCEAQDLNQCPVVTQQILAEAVHDVIASGAQVVNLSLGLAPGNYTGDSTALKNAFDTAYNKGVIIVGASGNHGRIGHNPLFDHPWVIPVVACDLQGNVISTANIGRSIGTRGVMAPGKDIRSCHSNGLYTRMSGTSVAAPFVTAGIARLWALYPRASATMVRQAVVNGGRRNRSVIPPLVDFQRSRNFISEHIN